LFGELQIESEMGLKMKGLHKKLLKEQSFLKLVLLTFSLRKNGTSLKKYTQLAKIISLLKCTFCKY